MSLSSDKKLGLWSLTSLVAGNMIGSGAYLIPASLAIYGSIGIFAWILTAIGVLFLAQVYARLSKMIPKSGGPYAYCRAAYGDYTGFQIAYNYWLYTWIGNAAISVGFVSYLSIFFPSLEHNIFHALLSSLSVLWFLTFINMANIRWAGNLQLVTTILKLIPLFLMAFVGIFFIHPDNLTTHFNVSNQSNLLALMGAGSITLWAFTGFESATIPAGRVEDPVKNIPRATLLGTLIVIVVYILSTISVMGLIPMDHLAHSTAPYAEAAESIFGSGMGKVVALCAMIAVFGELNGWVLLQGEMPQAAAADHLFPQVFAKRFKSGAPVWGLLISSCLITLLLLLRYGVSLIEEFTFIILLATFAALIPYIHTALAEVILLARDKSQYSKPHLIKAGIIAFFAFLYAFWAIIGAGKEIVFYGFLLYVSGIPVFYWVKRTEGKGNLIS